MTLALEFSAKLDSTDASAALDASLIASQGILGGLTLTVSVDDAANATAASNALDLSQLEEVVQTCIDAIGDIAGTVPLGNDLIDPVRSGIDLLSDAIGGPLEQDLETALKDLGTSFDDLRSTSGLEQLKTLAERVRGSGDLGALADVITSVLSLGGSGPLPQSSTGDVVDATLAATESVGALMMLDTLLSDAATLGGLAESHLPKGHAQNLMARLEAAVTDLERHLAGLDPEDADALDTVLAEVATMRGRADDVVEGLRNAMAMGEATLTVLDPQHLVARADSVLETLRTSKLTQAREALDRLAKSIRPICDIDPGDMAETALTDLLTLLEHHANDLAGRIDTLDVSGIADPVVAALSPVTQTFDTIQSGITAALEGLTATLDQVRRAVAALPLDQVARALTDAIAAIGGVLDHLSDLLGGIEAAIGAGATTAQQALTQAETAIATFRNALNILFEQAKAFLDDLRLDQVIGQTADAIQTVADVIGKADMAPYFSSAQGAINTTTGVIEKVPFALLPDSLEQELVDVIRPVKTVDLDAFADEIKDVLQINPDGTFSLRPQLEAGVADIQAKINDLITTLDGLDPRALVGQIDNALAQLETEVRRIEPSLALTPVTEGLDAVKALVAGVDLAALLDPLRDGFSDILTAVDAVKPSTLLAPLETEVDQLRGQIVSAIKLDQWGPEIDRLEAGILAIADEIDPAALEAPLTDAFDRARKELSEVGLPDPLQPLGALIGALLSGGGEDVLARAIEPVAQWLRGAENGAAKLEDMGGQLVASVTQMRTTVAQANPSALADRLSAARDRIDTAVAALPAGPGRDRLSTAVALADLSPELRSLQPSYETYLRFLQDTETALSDLVSKGFGEADTIAHDLRETFAPLTALLTQPKEILRRLGFTRFHDGLFGLIDELFETATPERLVGILMPVVRSLHARLQALLGAVLAPMRQIITDLTALIASFDLAALSAPLDAVHDAVRAEIAAFDPNTILGDGLTAFTNMQATVAGFDPLGPVVDTVKALQDTIARVLAMFDGGEILSVPIAVYDDIMGVLRALDIDTLLTPLYDRLDAISAQVSGGLDGTVTAFEGLQDALPDKVGSVTVTVRVEAT